MTFYTPNVLTIVDYCVSLTFSLYLKNNSFFNLYSTDGYRVTYSSSLGQKKRTTDS